MKLSKPTIILIISFIIIVIPLSILDYARFPYSDGVEHGAAVRALAKDLLHPGDPMLSMTSGLSPRYVPSILIMALFMKISGLDVLVVLKLFVIVGFAFFLSSVALFSNEYFQDSGQAPWSIVTVLFLWGLGWIGANAYMFSAILYTAYFPSVVSFSIALLALYFQLRFLRDQKNALLFMTILLWALCFVNHPLTGMFFLVCSGLLYLETVGLNKKTIIYFTLTIVTALLLTSIWPYYDFFSSFITIASGKMQNAMDYKMSRGALYSKPLLRSGLALAGIPFIGWYLLKRQRLLLWAGFLFFSFVYIAGYCFHISLAERAIFFVVFLLQIAFSRTCREWFSLSPALSTSRTRKIVTSAFILLLAGGVIIQLRRTYLEFIYPAFTFEQESIFPHYVTPNAMHNELKKYFNSSDIILSDLYSSWPVPVYTGAKIIGLFHTAPHITDNAQRIADIEAFYNVSTPNSERNEIIKKYGVTHIFLNFSINGKQLETVLRDMGYPIIFCSESFCIFSVKK